MILLMGAGTPLLEATGGRLSPAERIDIDRATGRVGDNAGLNTAFLDGERDPQAVVAAARRGVDAVSR